MPKRGIESMRGQHSEARLASTLGKSVPRTCKMTCNTRAGGLTSFGMGLNPSDFVVCPWALAHTDAPQLFACSICVEARSSLAVCISQAPTGRSTVMSN